MQWNDEKCLLLIELYGNHPIIWNPKDVNYYKKHLKDEAWEEIGARLGTTGQVCKEKMVNLLSSYRREKMKIKRRSGTGKWRDKPYESNWFAFSAFHFLTNRGTPLEESTAQENITHEIESTKNNTVPPTVEPQCKKPKHDPELQMLKEAFNILKTAANKQPSPPQAREQNAELRTFFDFIIEKMKNYSNQTKNAVQQDIFQVIVQADQGYYDDLPRYGQLTDPLNTSDQSKSHFSRASTSSMAIQTPCISVGPATSTAIRPTLTTRSHHSPGEKYSGSLLSDHTDSSTDDLT